MKYEKERRSFPLIVVGKEHYEEIVKLVDRIRNSANKRELEYASAKIKNEIAERFGKPAIKADLKPGKQYGNIRYSPLATAIRGNEQIPYHGEIYIEVWTYYEDRAFRCETAWGGYHESNLPGCPVIEIP